LIVPLGKISNGLQYTPCGKYIVFALGSILVVRNAKTGNNAFLDPEDDRIKVSCFAISRDGRCLASGHSTHEAIKVDACLWDLNKAKQICDEGVTFAAACLLRKLPQHFRCVQDIDFSCDSRFLISLGGRDDNNLVVWDVATGTAICGCLAGNEDVLCVRWCNTRSDRFVICGDFIFRVWHVCYETPKMHPLDAQMAGMRRVMQSLCISHDDKFAFVGSQSGEVMKFGIERGGIKKCLEPDDVLPCMLNYSRERFSQGIKTVACILNPSTGNTNVLAGAGDGTFVLMNPKLVPIKSHKAELVGAVTSICLSPDAKRICVGTSMSQRYIVDVMTFTPKLGVSCHYHPICDIKFPRECSDLFVTASQEDLRVWNCTTHREVIRIQVPTLQCNALEITPEGGCILSAWSDGRIRAFLPQTGKLKFLIPEAHADGATALAYCHSISGTNKYRFVSGGKDYRIRVWDVSDSQQIMLHSMKEHRGEIRSIVCNGDGTKAISSSTDGSCIVWDLQRGVRVSALFEQTLFNKALFHPDESQYLTCGAHKKITYWDAFDGTAIREIEGGGDEQLCLDIEPKGEFFISGGADGLLKLWHYDDGEALVTAHGHGGKINRAKFSPDKKRVVSVGEEGGIFIWRLSDDALTNDGVALH
jgi:WD40 repeat protein